MQAILTPLLVAHAHDRTLPELPLYLGNGGVYGLALIQYVLQTTNVCRLIGIVSRPIVLECPKDLTSQNTLDGFFARLGQNHCIWKQIEGPNSCTLPLAVGEVSCS